MKKYRLEKGKKLEIEGIEIRINEPNKDIKALGFPISTTGECPNMKRMLEKAVEGNLERLAVLECSHTQLRTLIYAKNQAKILSRSQVNPFGKEWVRKMEAKESSLIRKKLRLTPIFPKALIYLPRRKGGLGFCHFPKMTK